MNKIHDMIHLVNQMTDFRKKYGFNPFHNNKWREILQEDLLNKYYHGGFELCKPVHGPDIVNTEFEPEIENGELKGAETKTKSLSEKEGINWGLDKMNDPIKQKEIYDNDFWCFSSFKGSKIFVSFIVYGNARGFARLHKLFDEKINVLKNTIKECLKTEKRLPRDDIHISLADIITFEDDEIVVILNNEIVPMSDYKKLLVRKILYNEAVDSNTVLEEINKDEEHFNTIFN